LDISNDNENDVYFIVATYRRRVGKYRTVVEQCMKTMDTAVHGHQNSGT